MTATRILVRSVHSPSPSIKTPSTTNFGVLIAYVVPGFTALWGASYLSPTLRQWLAGASPDGPTLGGFLYVTVASMAAGLTVSTVRWLIVDTLHHWTGIPRRRWDYSRLQENIAAFEFLVENQYRHYQFHANSCVAVAFAYAAFAAANGEHALAIGAGAAVVEVILWLGSRNNLRNYHHRVKKLLGQGEP